jgi:hypothetical protein
MKLLLMVLLCIGAVVTRGSTNAVGLRNDIGSYVATEVQDTTLAGESQHVVTEYWFAAPSSWRVVCIECNTDTSREIIIVGRKAWELRDGTWVQGDFDSLKYPSITVYAAIATDYQKAEASFLSEGPVINGEPRRS